MSVYTHFIGIDIAKFTVAVACHGTHSAHSFTNTQEGFERFCANYDSFLQGALVILETTGGYESLFLKALLEKQIAVHRANTRHVKAFIRSLGSKAKTDELDALSLARYGYERHDRLNLYQSPKGSLETLQALAQRRLDLNQLLVAEKNRLQAPNISLFVKESCTVILSAIQDQLQQITLKIQTFIKQDPQLVAKQAVLKEIPGIGDIISSLLTVFLPELGMINRRQIASLTGLAPYPNESGTKTGYRRTKGGRQHVRSILFMAAMAASHSNSKLGDAYRQMLARGKKKMVALVAIMRKIIVIANAKIRDLFKEQENSLCPLAP